MASLNPPQAKPIPTDLPFERLLRRVSRIRHLVDAEEAYDPTGLLNPLEPLTPLDSDDESSDTPAIRSSSNMGEIFHTLCALVEDVELCEADRVDWMANTQSSVNEPFRSSPMPTPAHAPPPSHPNSPVPASRAVGRKKASSKKKTAPKEPRFRSRSVDASEPTPAVYRPPPPPSSHRPPALASVNPTASPVGLDSDSDSVEVAGRSGKRKRGDKAGQRRRKKARVQEKRRLEVVEGSEERDEERDAAEEVGAFMSEGASDGGRAGGANKDGPSLGKKAYKAKKKREKRARDREDAAHGRPYDKRHDEKKYHSRPQTVKLVNLRSFEVRYATQRGGYDAFSYKDKKVYTMQELKDLGFKELPWDGNDTVAILDNKNRLICVLLGPPKGMTEEETKSWERSMVELAETLERARVDNRDGFDEDGPHFKHDRGRFGVFPTGFTAGNGKTGPSNLRYAHAAHALVAEELLKDGNMKRVAAYASEALAYYFPLVYKHMCERLKQLCDVYPELKFPFGGLSIYPTVTFNLGPVSVTFGHNDCTNYAGIPCSITALGKFNADEGGHLVLFDFKLFVRFPAGRTILLSSAGLRHGNTQLSPDDRRYSVTQYCQGSLIRWVAYGFRKASSYTDAQKDQMDVENGEGWEAQLSRFSTWESLANDRRTVLDWERDRNGE